jgi:glucosamine--fructose-6-phosphate aminotransferase (isomerizing)
MIEANRSQLGSDILAQPQSLACVLDQQLGSGRAAMLQAASLIRSGKQVLITGIGASMFASIPLQYALCACGIDAVVVEAAELLHFLHRAYKDAVAIVVSRSGESIEIAKLVAMIQGQQPIIGVTNEPASLLAQKADVNLYIGSQPDGMVAIQTYTGTVLTLYLLAEMVRLSIDAAGEEMDSLQVAFSEVVKLSYGQLTCWDPFLESGGPVYLLGRGPSYASAMEGALLFSEVAKIAAVGMAAASFRHGPVEVVDSNFRGLIFASQGRACELNIALARDLARFGGHVRCIGPAQESAPGMDWCDLPSVPQRIAPLFEIVPVQVAALRMAQLRGIPEGTFRYAPQVTTDEASFALPETGRSPE